MSVCVYVCMCMCVSGVMSDLALPPGQLEDQRVHAGDDVLEHGDEVLAAQLPGRRLLRRLAAKRR